MASQPGVLGPCKEEGRELHEWGPAVCERLLDSHRLVLFHLSSDDGRATQTELLCSVLDVQWRDSVQHVRANVLAAKPKDVSHLVQHEAETDRSGLPRVRLLCRPARTPSCESAGEMCVKNCLHLDANIAQIYWDNFREDTWAASLQDWYQVVVGSCHLHALTPGRSLKMLEESMGNIEVPLDQRGYINKPRGTDEARLYTRKTAREGAKTREELEAAGSTWGHQFGDKRLPDIPGSQHKPLTVASPHIKVLVYTLDSRAYLFLFFFVICFPGLRVSCSDLFHGRLCSGTCTISCRWIAFSWKARYLNSYLEVRNGRCRSCQNPARRVCRAA